MNIKQIIVAAPIIATIHAQSAFSADKMLDCSAAISGQPTMCYNFSTQAFNTAKDLENDGGQILAFSPCTKGYLGIWELPAYNEYTDDYVDLQNSFIIDTATASSGSLGQYCKSWAMSDESKFVYQYQCTQCNTKYYKSNGTISAFTWDLGESHLWHLRFSWDSCDTISKTFYEPDNADLMYIPSISSSISATTYDCRCDPTKCTGVYVDSKYTSYSEVKYLGCGFSTELVNPNICLINTTIVCNDGYYVLNANATTGNSKCARCPDFPAASGKYTNVSSRSSVDSHGVTHYGINGIGDCYIKTSTTQYQDETGTFILDGGECPYVK